jgi:copper chaperone CopZ
MERQTFRANGMYCEACEKLLKMEIGEIKGVTLVEADYAKGIVEVQGAGFAEKQVIAAIEKAGYGVGEDYSGKSFERELGGFLADFASGKPNTATIRKCFIYSVASFAALAILAFALSQLLSAKPSQLAYFIYSAITAVAVGGAIALHRAYKSGYTCMEGMMIGMTIGMMAGFMFGAIAGATNGMFVGSIFGMAIGMLVGAYAGKCCGIMGIMEGLMAGLMGGTMGAMLTVMMAFDNLDIFIPIFLAACLLVLAGLKYMLHSYIGRRKQGALMPFAQFFSLCLALLLAAIAVIVFAPRAGVVV